MKTYLYRASNLKSTITFPAFVSYAILPEICAFIVGFSFTVWTKMRSLRVCVLADAILIPARPPTPPTAGN